MVNGFRYYRALESVSMIASALSIPLFIIYPCQIRVHQRWQSKLQLPAARKEWRPATAGSSPPCGCLSTVIHTTLVGLEPATFRSLVRRATSSATEPTTLFRMVRLVTSYDLPFPQNWVPDEPLVVCRISNDHLRNGCTDPLHVWFGVGFSGRRIEWRYFRFGSRSPSGKITAASRGLIDNNKMPRQFYSLSLLRVIVGRRSIFLENRAPH